MMLAGVAVAVVLVASAFTVTVVFPLEVAKVVDDGVYVAVTELLPNAKEVPAAVMLHFPAAVRVQLPSVVEPTENATVPAGVVAEFVVSATTAFSVVLLLEAMFAGVAVAVVVVTSELTVTEAVPLDATQSTGEGVKEAVTVLLP